MNHNTFDWTRFGKVVSKDFRNLWHNGGLTLVILTLIPSAAWLFWWAVGSNSDSPYIEPEIRWAFMVSVVVLAAALAPSRLYHTCNMPKEGIYFAMLPASKLEKYLSMLLNCVVLYPLCSFVGMFVLDMVLTLLPIGPYETWIWDTWDMNQTYVDDVEAQQIVDFLSGGVLVVFAVISYLQAVAIFVFGATIFKKHKFIKTVLWCWLIDFVTNLVLLPLFGDFALNSASGNLTAETFKTAYWVACAAIAVVAVVLFWWSARRLKKMTY